MDCETLNPTNSEKIEKLFSVLESIKAKLNSIDTDTTPLDVGSDER